MSARFRVLVADAVSSKGVEVLGQDGQIEVVTKTGLKEAELIAIADQFDGIVVRSQTKINQAVMAAASRLKVVGRAGVGVDNVDVEAATARGIVVMNTPGGNTISTAEHTFSLLLSLARSIPQAHASIKAGQWDRKTFQGVELCNKTLGIIGMGRIGSEVARRAIAFGLRVIVYDPYLALSRAKSLQVELADQLTPVLEQADFITVHMPLTPETQGILNAKTMAQCKKGVRLINCARGGLINEADLLAALKSGQVAGAALDVYEQEPPPKDFPFRDLPNVVLTPHLGASTAEAQESVGIEVAEQIYDYLVKGMVRNAVNMPNVDAHTLQIIKPYLMAGEKVARLLAALAPPHLETLNISYSGSLTEVDTTAVTRSILKGLLARAGGPEINEVNAPSLAKSLGLKITESKQSEVGDFTELLTLEASSGSEKFEIAVTFFARKPRIVRMNGQPVEAIPEGVLLIMENRDRPGIVGWIGTLLGQHKINIANMSLGRNEAGQRALSVLNLDSFPKDEVIREIASDPDIYSVKVVEL
jgi:D-3-phosphoglycerate dehydrogenase